MSWQATAFVKTLSESATGHKITRSEKLLLFVLADSTDPHSGWAWPSMARIAEEALFSERQIRRILAKLEKSGFIEVEHADGGRKSNRYRLVIDGTKCPNKNAVRTDISDSCTDISTRSLGHNSVPRVVGVEKAVVNPLTPLEKPNASLNDLEPQDAERAVVLLLGVSGYTAMAARDAVGSVKRRKPEMRYTEIPEFIKNIWHEVKSQPRRAIPSLKTFLNEIGSYIESDHWRVKKTEFKPQIDWQGGYIGEDGVYINKHGKRVPGFICPPKPKEMAGD